MRYQVIEQASRVPFALSAAYPYHPSRWQSVVEWTRGRDMRGGVAKMKTDSECSWIAMRACE